MPTTATDKTKHTSMVSPDVCETFARDGAAVVRNVLPPAWVARMRAAIDHYEVVDRWSTLWMSRRDPEFAAFAMESGMAQLAGELMGVDRVRFLYDQLFVKQPKSDEPTPLHQDLPYWPVEGRDILSVWVPFDPVRAENSVVQYIKGSHLWGRMFEPASFVKGGKRNADELGSAGYERIADPQALIDTQEVLCWELNPGDVLIHHPLTLHFATPNMTEAAQRRAIALRYVGPDARFLDRPGHFMRHAQMPAHIPKDGIMTGTPVGGPDYPVAWMARH